MFDFIVESSKELNLTKTAQGIRAILPGEVSYVVAFIPGDALLLGFSVFVETKTRPCRSSIIHYTAKRTWTWESFSKG